MRHPQQVLTKLARPATKLVAAIVLSSAPGWLNTTLPEFVAWGGVLYVEPDLKISFPDGNRDMALKYTSHVIHDDTLFITLKDQSREVYVTLEYRMDK